MNSISNKDPYLARRRKLEDKNRYEVDKEPRPKKGPRRKLRVIDILNKDPDQLEELGTDE